MHVALAGSTGLVGGHALAVLREDPRVSRVTVLTRRPTGLAGGKVEEVILDFEALAKDPRAGAAGLPSADALLCALGTTLKAAGSKDAFTRVDKDYVVALGVAAKARGVRTFGVVSALGADARSRVFYNRVKGEAEEALRDLAFGSLHVLRPSLLVGARKDVRPLERAAVAIAPLLRAVCVGPLGAFAPIDAKCVASCLATCPHEEGGGIRVHDSSSMQAEGRAWRKAPGLSGSC